jgi:phage tail tape-measure protein
MKSTHATAIIAGTSAGTVLSESAEQVIASVAASVAVYLANAILRWAIKRWGLSTKPIDKA